MAGLALSRLGRERSRAALGRAVAAALVVQAGGTIARWRRGDRGGGRGPLAPAALGPVAAAWTTAEAIQARGVGGFAPWAPSDRCRLALGGALLGLALPWLFADLGRYVDDAPLLGRLYLGCRVPGRSERVAVHLGHHHGLDGALLAWTALALSRQLPNLSPGRGTAVCSVALAALLVYGLARAAEDAWLEQVVKRGWTGRRLPSLVERGRPVGWRAWLGTAALGLAVDRWWRPAVPAGRAGAASPRLRPTRTMVAGGIAAGGRP